MRVDGPKSWKIRVGDMGTHLSVAYVCPTCHGPNSINLQPLPWRDADGQEMTEATTELWCFRCQQGTAATIR